MSLYLLGNKDSVSPNSPYRFQDQITFMYVDIEVAWYTSFLPGFWANSELRPKSWALKYRYHLLWLDWRSEVGIEVNRKACSCIWMLAPTRELTWRELVKNWNVWTQSLAVFGSLSPTRRSKGWLLRDVLFGRPPEVEH